MFKDKLKNIISIGTRDSASGIMQKIADNIKNVGQQRINYGESWKHFAEDVSKMALSQNPQVEQNLKIVQEDFEALGQIHISFGETQIRTSQDIFDVYYRYEAVFAKNEEYMKARFSYKTACEKLEKAIQKNQQAQSKGNYDKNKDKLEAKINKRKEEKRNTLEGYKAALQTLISAKERFALFKVRRFTEAWTRYSIASQRAANDEKQLMQKLKEDLQNLKDTTFDNNQLSSLEERLSQHLESN